MTRKKMAKKEYSAEDIRVLGEIEHIRLNPAMYIGHTDNPAHLVEEALDNALDEALAGHATIVAVMVESKTGVCKVIDNGRGIPLTNNTPVTISSKLFSGAKFQDKKTAYEISTGLHGVGLVAVNALSSEYAIEVYRDGRHGSFEFKNTKLIKKLVKKHDGKVPFSTKVQFQASKKIFDSIMPDLDRIRKRLIVAAAEMSDDMALVLTVDEDKEVFRMSLDDFFKTYCLSGDSQMFYHHIISEKKPESFSVMMAFEDDGSAAAKYVTSVNLLPVESGGTHILAFQDMLRDFFTAKAKKYDYSFRPNDCFYGLRAYLSLNLKAPDLSGQTKERLVNKKADLEKFTKDLKQSLELLSTENEEELLALLQRFQDYRRKLDSKRMVKNGTGKRASTKFTKLRDCPSRDGELFIVEGESAGGSIIQSRDKSRHAILPLKGKSIPNITTKKNILKNTEVGELITAIGTGIEPHFDFSKMRYEKIICAADADSDGAHIACLVTMVIAILVPEVIKEGRYYIAQTPLYAINEKKEFVPLWNEEELEEAKSKNRTISRFKGLGELTPAQLKICLLNEDTRNLRQIQYSENMEDLIKLFSSADEKRKLLEG